MRTRKRMGSLFSIPVGLVGAVFATIGLQIAVEFATDLPSLIGGSVVGLLGLSLVARSPFLGVRRVERGLLVRNLERSVLVPKGAKVFKETWYQGISPLAVTAPALELSDGRTVRLTGLASWAFWDRRTGVVDRRSTELERWLV